MRRLDALRTILEKEDRKGNLLIQAFWNLPERIPAIATFNFVGCCHDEMKGFSNPSQRELDFGIPFQMGCVVYIACPCGTALGCTRRRRWVVFFDRVFQKSCFIRFLDGTIASEQRILSTKRGKVLQVQTKT